MNVQGYIDGHLPGEHHLLMYKGPVMVSNLGALSVNV